MPHSATKFAWNGVSGSGSTGGPFPFADIPPETGEFDGSVALEAASVVGIILE